MIAGVDLSTLAVDVVMLELGTNDATHYRRRLDIGPGKALDRVRRIRDALPARANWDDSGILLIAIEEPFSRASMSGQVPIHWAIGSVLACLPVTMRVALLRADDWRRACELPIRGARGDLKKAAISFARDRWGNAPPTIDDNAADAYCLAWAGRELYEQAERERSAA